MNDKSDGDSDPEENNAAGTATAASPPQVSKTSTSTSSSGGFHHHLTFPHVAKIFVKLRRVQKKVKAHHIDSSSGDEPQTHSSLLNAHGGLVPEVMRKLARLEIQEEFVCLDGVDVEKLLRASRLALLEHASPLLANVLVDEQWTSSICGPKHRSDGSFRVHIRYAATAATRDSSRRDSRQPIALEKASGVPGLMTIASRETVALSVVSLFEEVRIATQS
ncbi:uncharacterized protein FOMMEDRAFT_97148 [Fomitiporia mediterranea MF3/22]|uniref:uncharacterized protein n=1 Tax=Fomitiporia mediterranea (strain MF3/22) TaxID=694068 RepID=UPI00044086BA|nr:uncharacterized protein FOMMEDRAFT_97148 [Fomitiporia mediterranea MF3/22]EJC98228.1 hypothetical protein FOMMEDRAFT_97148 [Fomitiporia mediterranea MF3/22]